MLIKMEILLSHLNGKESYCEIEAQNEEEVVPLLIKQLKLNTGKFYLNKIDTCHYEIKLSEFTVALNIYKKHKGRLYQFANSNFHAFLVLLKHKYFFIGGNIGYVLHKIDDINNLDHINDHGLFSDKLLTRFMYTLLRYDNKPALEKLFSYNEDNLHIALKIAINYSSKKVIKYLINRGAKHSVIYEKVLPNFTHCDLERSSDALKDYLKYPVFSLRKELYLIMRICHNSPPEEIHKYYGRELLVKCFESNNTELILLALYGPNRSFTFNRTKELSKGVNSYSLLWYIKPQDIFLMSKDNRLKIERDLIYAGYDLKVKEEK